MIPSKKVIAIDLGGTNIRAGIVNEEQILNLESVKVKSSGSVDEVLSQIFDLINSLGTEKISGIGMGVPGPVDEKKGIVYELINIPAWKKVPVKEIFENKYSTPCYVQNDANCFALAEKIYGKGKNIHSFIGLIVGTGMAGGIILNNELYPGPNGMAGEFGMMGYRDKFYEYYCSGQFFEHFYSISAKEAALNAEKGEQRAIQIWNEFGTHLGKAIEAILYAYDPEKIILGGSVSKAFHLFEKPLWHVLDNFAFKNSIQKFNLEVSELEEPGVLGAAALHFG